MQAAFRCCLMLLAEVWHETSALDTARAVANSRIMQQHSNEVLALLQQLLTGQGTTGNEAARPGHGSYPWQHRVHSVFIWLEIYWQNTDFTKPDGATESSQ